MRGKQKLTARGAATSKPGRYGDGNGLYLVVSPRGARKWVFRFTFGGKVTEMGLGSANLISLAEARDKAHAARKSALRDKIQSKSGAEPQHPRQESLPSGRSQTRFSCPSYPSGATQNIKSNGKLRLASTPPRFDPGRLTKLTRWLSSPC